jgi:hypothetical protein
MIYGINPSLLPTIFNLQPISFSKFQIGSMLSKSFDYEYANRLYDNDNSFINVNFLADSYHSDLELRPDDILYQLYKNYFTILYTKNGDINTNDIEVDPTRTDLYYWNDIINSLIDSPSIKNSLSSLGELLNIEFTTTSKIDKQCKLLTPLVTDYTKSKYSTITKCGIRNLILHGSLKDWHSLFLLSIEFEKFLNICYNVESKISSYIKVLYDAYQGIENSQLDSIIRHDSTSGYDSISGIIINMFDVIKNDNNYSIAKTFVLGLHDFIRSYDNITIKSHSNMNIQIMHGQIGFSHHNHCFKIETGYLIHRTYEK